MKFVLLSSVAISLAHGEITAAPGLWPLPRHVEFGTHRGVMAKHFKVEVPPVKGGAGRKDMVQEAVARYSEMCWGPSVRKASPSDQGAQFTTLKIEVPDATRNPIDLKNADEKYTLEIKLPTATIKADSGVGVLRGLETFCQMLQQETYGGDLSIMEVNITDYPRFGFRGLLVDSARHFLPLDILRQHVDALLYNKMNVLHWHIVDGNSFPYVSKVLPKLSEAAYTQRETYTIEEITEFIEFARLRGVRVIPEFDTPGHVSPSWAVGYPDVVTKCDVEASGRPLRADLNSTYDFLKTLFGEVGHVFPDSYLHLGGDEVSFACWNKNPEVKKFMQEHNFTGADLENFFENKLLDIVGGLNKSYMVWQEIFNNGLKVKPDTIIDVWKGFDKKTLAKAAKENYSIIVSGGWYLDDGDGACCAFDGWKFYKQDPADFPGGPEAEAAGKLIGGKAAMWSEHVDATNAISRVWPRTSAVGERLWSDKSANDEKEADPRLNSFRCSMVSRGITAEAVDPGFCMRGVPAHYAPPYMHMAEATEIVV